MTLILLHHNFHSLRARHHLTAIATNNINLRPAHAQSKKEYSSGVRHRGGIMRAKTPRCVQSLQEPPVSVLMGSWYLKCLLRVHLYDWNWISMLQIFSFIMTITKKQMLRHYTMTMTVKLRKRVSKTCMSNKMKRMTPVPQPMPTKAVQEYIHPSKTLKSSKREQDLNSRSKIKR